MNLKQLIESGKSPEDIIEDATLSPGIGANVDRMNVDDDNEGLDEAESKFNREKAIRSIRVMQGETRGKNVTDDRKNEIRKEIRRLEKKFGL